MARIAYDRGDAEAFAATRHLTADGLGAWREAVSRHLGPRPGLRLLDLGAGTGMWAQAFTRWYAGLVVVAVEPSPAMRAHAVHRLLVGGDAVHLPLADDSVDGAWLSTVVHHVSDLHRLAAELRRVVRPGGPVLIRSAFAGRPDGITLFRYFPEAVDVLATYPAVAAVESAFAAGGFTRDGFEAVPQVTAASLSEATASLRRDAHTPLKLITDEAYAAGLARMRAAAATATGPVIDALDLLVLR